MQILNNENTGQKKLSKNFSKKEKQKETKFERKFRPESTFRKFYFRVSATPFIITILAVVVFFLGGGLFNITTPLPPIIQAQGRTYFYSPFDSNTQLPSEGIVSMIFIVIAVAGGYIANRSLKSMHNVRQGSIILFVGIVMLVIGVLGMNFLLGLKLPGR